MATRRIDLSLFDDNLKNLINSSAKIFPYNYSDVFNNYNPNGYSYVRVIDDVSHKNEIYVWDGGVFSLIGADDLHTDWSDILNKPITFSPSSHNHGIIDITDLQSTLNFKVDVVVGKSLSTNDFTTDLKTKLEGLSNTASIDYSTMQQNLDNHKVDLTAHSNKADKSYVDIQLASKADSSSLNGHTGNTTVHVLQTDKDSWNIKSQITQGTSQPVTGWWFKEI